MSEAPPARHDGGSLLSVSTVSAGFLAVLVSYAGPLLVYLQAARAMQVPDAAFTSWVFAISMAAGLSSLILSLWARAPVITAWSAPGSVLLISIGTGMPFPDIVGAYIVAALAILIIGATGMFDRLVRALPAPVAAGMMAGILFGFGVDAMSALGSVPLLFTLLLAAFLILRILVPNLAIIGVLALGLLLASLTQDVSFGQLHLALARPQLTPPAFSLQAMLGLAVPLIIVTLSGQFLPGMAILRAHGYHVAARPIIVLSALTSLPAALLGGITTALASITMAFCASPEAHPDPHRRYGAGIACGLFFCTGGIFAGSIVQLLTMLPETMIAMLAGFALLGAIQKSLADMLSSPTGAQAGLLTFMVAASGVDLLGVNAAFWGVLVGLAAWHLPALLRRSGQGFTNSDAAGAVKSGASDKEGAPHEELP